MAIGQPGISLLRVGMRAVWIAFGAAIFYLVVAIAVPAVIVLLRNHGVDVSSEAAKNVTRLAAVVAAVFGGALGYRKALAIEERHPKP